MPEYLRNVSGDFGAEFRIRFLFRFFAVPAQTVKIFFSPFVTLGDSSQSEIVRFCLWYVSVCVEWNKISTKIHYHFEKCWMWAGRDKFSAVISVIVLATWTSRQNSLYRITAICTGRLGKDEDFPWKCCRRAQITFVCCGSSLQHNTMWKVLSFVIGKCEQNVFEFRSRRWHTYTNVQRNAVCVDQALSRWILRRVENHLEGRANEKLSVRKELVLMQMHPHSPFWKFLFISMPNSSTFSTSHSVVLIT